MHGFTGFAADMKNLQQKLKKERFTEDFNSLSIYVDYP